MIAGCLVHQLRDAAGRAVPQRAIRQPDSVVVTGAVGLHERGLLPERRRLRVHDAQLLLRRSAESPGEGRVDLAPPLLE